MRGNLMVMPAERALFKFPHTLVSTAPVLLYLAFQVGDRDSVSGRAEVIN